MHALFTSTSKFIFAISLIVVTPFSLANQCGDVSPLLITLGEGYYDLESTPKSELFNQSIQPNELIETLKSRRFKNGEAQRTFCFGATSLATRVRNSELQLIEAARTNSFNEIVLKAYEYDASKKTSHRATVFIPLSTQSSTLIGNHGLSVNTRHRQPVRQAINSNIYESTTAELDPVADRQGRGTHLREISMTARGDNNGGVEIKQLIYVNGYLAEWFTWQLGSKARYSP